MNPIYKKACLIVTLFLLIISTVSAEGTSIILDNDQTSQFSGTAMVMCSLAIVIFAALIIIKILLSSRGD